MIGGAFSRTRPLLMAKKEVGMAMSKFWWKHNPVAEAEIRMHLSMNEQQTVYPWLFTFPQKVVQRAHRYMWPIGTCGFIYVVQVYGKQGEHEEDFEHRF